MIFNITNPEHLEFIKSTKIKKPEVSNPESPFIFKGLGERRICYVLIDNHGINPVLIQTDNHNASIKYTDTAPIVYFTMMGADITNKQDELGIRRAVYDYDHGNDRYDTDDAIIEKHTKFLSFEEYQNYNGIHGQVSVIYDYHPGLCDIIDGVEYPIGPIWMNG